MMVDERRVIRMRKGNFNSRHEPRWSRANVSSNINQDWEKKKKTLKTPFHWRIDWNFLTFYIKATKPLWSTSPNTPLLCWW
jgi:hypothetical protein